MQQAKHILESLRIFLSFARGAACGLPIQWGRGIDGEIVWRQFVSPIVDPWQGQYRSWFDEHHGEILPELFDPFCRGHGDQELRESLVLALHWYRHCNTNSSGLEGSLVLGMAALDFLGALIVVDRCGWLSAQPAGEADHGRESYKSNRHCTICAPCRYTTIRLSRTTSTGKPPHSAGLNEGDQTPFPHEGLTVTEISRELGINRQTVYRWIARRRVGALTPVGRCRG